MESSDTAEGHNVAFHGACPAAVIYICSSCTTASCFGEIACLCRSFYGIVSYLS